MKSTGKLCAEDRRAAILASVRRVFAEKGFDRTTTRELAHAAGVSEALLFKHFPNKEALFAAMQSACCTPQILEHCERLYAMESGTPTLVLLVHFLITVIVKRRSADDDEKAIQYRLMLRSLAEDGEFARLLLAKIAAEWVPKFEDCLREAIASGDAVESPVSPTAAGWFVHNIATAIMLFLLPGLPIIDYGLSEDALVVQAVWFALRGIGLKEKAIKRYCTPKFLARWTV